MSGFIVYTPAGRELKRRNDAIDRWVLDHAYSPDDIVIGTGAGNTLTDSQTAELGRLLDLARPGWREILIAANAKVPD